MWHSYLKMKIWTLLIKCQKQIQVTFEFSFKLSKHSVKVGENSCICNLHHTVCCNYFEMDKEKPIIYWEPLKSQKTLKRPKKSVTNHTKTFLHHYQKPDVQLCDGGGGDAPTTKIDLDGKFDDGGKEKRLFSRNKT